MFCKVLISALLTVRIGNPNAKNSLDFFRTLKKFQTFFVDLEKYFFWISKNNLDHILCVKIYQLSNGAILRTF